MINKYFRKCSLILNFEFLMFLIFLIFYYSTLPAFSCFNSAPENISRNAASAHMYKSSWIFLAFCNKNCTVVTATLIFNPPERYANCYRVIKKIDQLINFQFFYNMVFALPSRTHKNKL